MLLDKKGQRAPGFYSDILRIYIEKCTFQDGEKREYAFLNSP